MNDAPAPIERAVLAGYLRIIDPPPGFVVPLFRAPELSGADCAPSYLIQEIDAEQTITGFTPLDPGGGDVVAAAQPAEKRVGEPCVLGYELSPGNVASGTHAELRACLRGCVNEAGLRERPFARWEVADFCGLEDTLTEIAREVRGKAGRSRSLAFFNNGVLAKSIVRARLAAAAGGQSLPAGSFHVVERGGSLAIEVDEGVSAEARAALNNALAEFVAKQPRLAAAAAKVVVHVGVDPRNLPDRAVFKDVDAPWCPEMVVIPAGTFLMGSPEEEGRWYAEGPQHTVTIRTRFALGRYAVTFDEYDQFCAATKREQPNDQGWGRGRRPVINVSWEDAVAYCEWLAWETGQRYRLPSEAEWEYACRAGTTTRYSWGDAITAEKANYSESKLGKTTKVGAYLSNPWGFFDMHGNVWEWVEDVWHDSYREAPRYGLPWRRKNEDRSGSHVIRGGSYDNASKFLRSVYRVGNRPHIKHEYVGFRVARTV